MCLSSCPVCQGFCSLYGASNEHPTHHCSKGHDWVVPPITVTGNEIPWSNVYIHPGNMGGSVYTQQTAVSFAPYAVSGGYFSPTTTDDSKYQEMLKENEKRQAEIEAKKLQDSKEEKEKRKENLFLSDGLSKRGIDLDEDLSTG